MGTLQVLAAKELNTFVLRTDYLNYSDCLLAFIF